MAQQKTKEPIVRDGQRLVFAQTGKPVFIGVVVRTFRGERVKVVGASAPHKPGSTGRVQVEFVGKDWSQEFFPGVIGAEWR